MKETQESGRGPELKAGVVRFGFPPGYRRGASPGAGPPGPPGAAAAPAAGRSSLTDLLAANGVPYVDASVGPNGVDTAAALSACLEQLRREGVGCLLVDAFHWSRVALVAALIRELDLPTGLYAHTADGWNGVTLVTAVSGSLRETAGPRHALLAERFLDTESGDLLTWLRAMSALQRLRRSRLLLWGGSYGADIPYTRSDPAGLEGPLFREIMAEGEIVLVERARRILHEEPERVRGFRDWLRDHGAAVRFDGGMLRPESFDLQAALYLAARDRLRELGPEAVAGVAVKCHFEISIDPVGVTECLIPAFLPFGADSEGPQPVVPVSCEGDLNGLAGQAMLHALNPEVPPLFGDLVSYRRDHILMRNCGGASVYWAARSIRPEEALPRVEVLPNMHGRSGGAVHFETPGGPEVTFLRLFRAAGTFRLFTGEARVLAPERESVYTDPWPHTRLRFASDPYLFYRAAPCNHGGLTEGQLARELETMARHLGMPVVRCDSDAALRRYLEELGERGGR